MKAGFSIGCFTLALSLVALVLGFAPFTPAVIAMPVVLLLSCIVAWMGSRRLAIMSSYICLGMLLTSAMTEAIVPIEEGTKVLFVLVSTPALAAYLLINYSRNRGQSGAA